MLECGTWSGRPIEDRLICHDVQRHTAAHTSNSVGHCPRCSIPPCCSIQPTTDLASHKRCGAASHTTRLTRAHATQRCRDSQFPATNALHTCQPQAQHWHDVSEWRHAGHTAADVNACVAVGSFIVIGLLSRFSQVRGIDGVAPRSDVRRITCGRTSESLFSTGRAAVSSLRHTLPVGRMSAPPGLSSLPHCAHRWRRARSAALSGHRPCACRGASQLARWRQCVSSAQWPSSARARADCHCHLPARADRQRWTA